MGRGKIFKNNAFYMVAGFLPSAVGLLTLPLFSRYLSPEDYGILALVQTMNAFLPVVLTLQFPASLRRFYFDYQGPELQAFVSTSFAAILFGGGFMTILLNFSLPTILGVAFPQSSAGHEGLFRIGLFTAFLQALANFNALLLRVRQKAPLFMRTALLAFFVALTVNVCLVVFWQIGALGMVLGQLASAAVALAGYTFFNRSLFKLRFKPVNLNGAFAYVLPLIPSALLIEIYLYSDRIVLDRYVPLAMIGLYGFSTRIACAFKKLVNEFNEAFLPHFMETALKDEQMAVREASQIADTFLFLFTLVLVVLTLFSYEFLQLLFDPRFHAVWFMLPVLCSAYFFRSVYCFSVAGVLFRKKTVYMPAITAFAAMINVGLNLLLVPRFGVMAAVWVMVASILSAALLATWCSWKTLFVPLKYGRIVLYYGYFLVALSGTWWCHHDNGIALESWPVNSWGVKILLLMPGFALAWFHWRDIRTVWQKILNSRRRRPAGRSPKTVPNS